MQRIFCFPRLLAGLCLVSCVLLSVAAAPVIPAGSYAASLLALERRAFGLGGAKAPPKGGTTTYVDKPRFGDKLRATWNDKKTPDTRTYHISHAPQGHAAYDVKITNHRTGEQTEHRISKLSDTGKAITNGRFQGMSFADHKAVEKFNREPKAKLDNIGPDGLQKPFSKGGSKMDKASAWIHGEPRPTPVDYSFQKTYGGINVHVKDPKTGVSFKQLEREHNPTYKEIKKGIFPGYVNNGKALDYARQQQRKP